ncbi:MAG: hypothetical protein M3314_09430 [Actinomycetota bacterium]|nr:hypothetical protein [Actinomycetota bacterium]
MVVAAVDYGQGIEDVGQGHHVRPQRLRKRRVTEEHVVSADLRRDRVEVDADPQVRERITEGDGGIPGRP